MLVNEHSFERDLNPVNEIDVFPGDRIILEA